MKIQKGTKLLLEGGHVVFKRRLRTGVEILGMVMRDNLMSWTQEAYKQMAHRRTTMRAVPRLVQSRKLVQDLKKIVGIKKGFVEKTNLAHLGQR